MIIFKKNSEMVTRKPLVDLTWNDPIGTSWYIGEQVARSFFCSPFGVNKGFRHTIQEMKMNEGEVQQKLF